MVVSEEKREQSVRQIKRVTYLSIYLNGILISAKLAVGIIFSSIALVADGIHSLSDFITDVAVLMGAHFGAKKPDDSHQYGHGRLETFSALFVAGGLFLLGGLMIYKAGAGIRHIYTDKELARQIGLPVLWVALTSVILKEILYHITKSVAIKTKSSAVYANAWHDRADALSSFAVIIGYTMVRWLDYPYGDHIAAIVIGLMVIMVSVKIVGECMADLTEMSVDKKTIEQIQEIINTEQNIRQWHNLRSRTVGREVFLDLHILVDPELSITEAHKISENLEKTLDEQLSRPVNITIHIEPDIPELRK